LLECRALEVAQPDVARARGLAEIRRIAALTSAHGVRLGPHAWGSGALFAASIHVAMAATECHILEGTQGYMPMMWELFNEPFDIRPDGMVHAPDRLGLGFTLPRSRWSGSAMSTDLSLSSSGLTFRPPVDFLVGSEAWVTDIVNSLPHSFGKTGPS